MALHKIWSDLRKGENIDLYLTVLVAFGLGILNIVGSAPSTWITSVILAALGVLAISALKSEYHTGELLRRLTASTGEQLQDRSGLLPVREFAQAASEISFLGVSGISVLLNDLGFFERKIKEGCKLRFILLDPDSPALQTWNLLTKVTTTESDIKTALEFLKGLMRMERAKGKCEVRLSKVYPPFALLISDISKNTGLMNVEFYTYKTTFSDRPHIQLSQVHNQKWFNFYKAQFEQFWSDAEKWNPQLKKE